MAKTTAISWCRSTFNPFIGCTKVSPGCDHCYASVSTPARSLKVVWGAGQPRRRTSPANWRTPLRWNDLARQEQETGVSQTGDKWHTPGFWPVFCASLADVFDNEVPSEWRADLFRLIADTPHLIWMLLTKRIGNVPSMLDDAGVLKGMLPPNVWLGITVVNQEEADRDIHKLLAVPAAKRFVSYEPALGPVDFGLFCENWSDDIVMDPETGARDCCRKCDFTGIGNDIDWIIIGGESDQPGMKARPFDVRWARDTVDQCKAAGVPVFVKQAGSFVIDRNDADFDGCDPRAWPDHIEREERIEWAPFGYEERHQGAPIRIYLRDRAGANPAEWPEDLRRQEHPK